MMVASFEAGWWGDSQTTAFLFPFAAVFGGVAQFAAGMWSYKARDVIATAMHGMWGSFWIGFGILELLFATGTLPPQQGAFPALGFWFIALAWITIMGAIAAMSENLALSAVLHTLWIGSGLLAVGELVGSDAWRIAAGWVLVLSAVLAWYTASALMFEGVRGKPILPVGMAKHKQQEPAVDPGASQPGVQKGQ